MARSNRLLTLIERLDRMQENHAYRTPIEQILTTPHFEPPDIDTVGVFEAMPKKTIFNYVTKVLPGPALKCEYLDLRFEHEALEQYQR